MFMIRCVDIQAQLQVEAKKKSISHCILMYPLGTARLGNRETDRLAAFVRRSFKTNVSGKHLCFLDVLYKTETEPIKTFYEGISFIYSYFLYWKHIITLKEKR